MAQALAEQSARKVDAEPDTIEATLNYIVDDGTKVFTETGAPGATDRRTGGKPDPHRVTLHNGRHRDFTLEQTAFISSPTTPRSRTSSTRPKCGASTIRRWKRW